MEEVINYTKKPYIKSYTNKNGELKKYSYNQHLYYKKFYENNKNTFYKKKFKCDICNIEILLSNKTNHLKSNKHKTKEIAGIPTTPTTIIIH